MKNYIKYDNKSKELINMKQLQESKFLLYETDEVDINVDVILKDETIWASQKNISQKDL